MLELSGARPRPEPFHPELRLGRFIPRLTVRPPHFFPFRLTMPSPKGSPRVQVTVERVAGPTESIRLLVFRPRDAVADSAALFWVHGGGLVAGSPEQDGTQLLRVAESLGITIIACSYRVAPENPAPAALDDVVAGYRAVLADSGRFGIDPSRVALGGASAGGGLAAAACQRLLDEGGPLPRVQILVYPMLDDRTALRSDIDERHVRVWTNASNRIGWRAYLGCEPGSPDTPPYAVPARRLDLHGLPPAWIGVGSLDLFHDEDVSYANRLREAGVACTVTVVPGAFHGFDGLFPKTDVAQTFVGSWSAALIERLAIQK